MHTFTRCPEPTPEQLTSSSDVLESPAQLELLQKSLRSHRRFWAGRIMDAVETELSIQDLTVADITDARRRTAGAFHQEFEAVATDMAKPGALDPRQPIPVIERGLSLVAMSRLYRGIILDSSSGTVLAEIDGTAVGEGDTVPEIMENSFGQPRGYALHVTPEVVADRFAEDALPAAFSESWCAANGLYVRCVNPAAPESMLVSSLEEEGTTVDFDFMVSLYPHLGSAAASA